MVQQEQAKVLRDFDDLNEQEEPVVAPSRFNKKFGLAALGIAAVCGLAGAAIATFSGGSSSGSSSVVDEFSASGVLTSSTLEDTPLDLGDATFGVYFNRDKDTKAITFEMTIAATDSNGHILTASVLDGQFSLWTTGPVAEYTDQSQFSILPTIAGKNLYDCDFTIIALQSWEENYAIESIGDTITINLGEAGGSVVFTIDAGTGLPNAVTWGAVSGSLTSFEAGSSQLRGALGTKVPIEYPCVAAVEPVITGEVAGDVTLAEAQATIDAIETTSRKLSATEREEGRRELVVGRSVDSDMMKLADGAYGVGSCGGASGWAPWISIEKDNAYAQVCVKDSVCAIAFRGSNDLQDWISNLSTLPPWLTTNAGGVDVPTGFYQEYERLTTTNNWNNWESLKDSSCSGGIISTGHSLGAAIASIYAFADSEVTTAVTFASPKMGGSGQDCSSGRRYYITATWGSDPVPGVPPFTSHPHVGYEMNGYLSWFRTRYRLINRGCGDQGGGGVNVLNHLAGPYLSYTGRLL